MTQQTEPRTQQNAEYSIPYILGQIAALQADTSYVNEAIDKLVSMGDGDSGDCGSPGNILGQAKAQALGDIVRCREATNQQILNLYEKMFNDLSKVRW